MNLYFKWIILIGKCVGIVLLGFYLCIYNCIYYKFGLIIVDCIFFKVKDIFGFLIYLFFNNII